MKIYLKKAIFINRAPFEKLELDFNENEIAVLTAVNGKGKTTIISHIVDALYEMARPYYEQEFENKENKLYRVSSSLFNLDQRQTSYVYLRFKAGEDIIDYIDIRNNCTQEQYDRNIVLENKIPFDQFQQSLANSGYVKSLSSNYNKEIAIRNFSNNILTYFPSYRYEIPGYLNEIYQHTINFRNRTKYVGLLTNPIEVISELPEITNWIMDVIVDNQYLNFQQDDILNELKEIGVNGNVDSDSLSTLFSFINTRITLKKSVIQHNLSIILSNTLVSKNYGDVRFGIGKRNMGGARVQIVKNNGTQVYPTIFHLSSGEASLLCLFGEILKQADTIKNEIILEEITGIVLIDEVDKHLHIKLQKEILPKLFKLFPNIQFIVSSHSPFLNMGLAEETKERSKIIDLDNYGISNDPTTNDLYIEVYNMMISENEKYRERYDLLEKRVAQGIKPLIITEGKTDIIHLKKAQEILGRNDLDVEYYIIEESTGWGDSKLKPLLEQLSKVPRDRKIIGIFDRDVKEIITFIEKDGTTYKNHSNNIYSFCIPIPPFREEYQNISIEFYYPDENLKKEYNGKRLYFTNEVAFRQFPSNKKVKVIEKLTEFRQEDEYIKKVFDEDIGECNWIHSKTKFAELVESDYDFISDFDFSNFNLIFDRIKEIIEL